MILLLTRCPRRESRGHKPLQAGKSFQEIGLLAPASLAPEQDGKYRSRPLHVTDNHGVEEIGHRSRIEGCGPPAMINGKWSSRPGEERDSREIEHVQNIGEAEFILERDPTISNRGEASKTRARIRKDLCPSGPSPYRSRSKSPFTGHSLYPVHDMIRI